MSGGRVEAVIFDWGGTLTPWHDVDLSAAARALLEAVVARDMGQGTAAAVLEEADRRIWARAREEHRSATIDDVFAEAGLAYDPERLGAYRDFWEPHTHTDEQVAPLLEELRARGAKVGVLSNTIWPRAWHEEFFARDGVLDLIDGAVYTSEIPHAKPAPEAFRAAMDAVGVEDPAACVFVGDRLFEDVHGPHEVGMRAIHVPHSTIPADQHGHTDGEPDAVVQELVEILDVLEQWGLPPVDQAGGSR
ncbi:HAD family hydrolase [Nocardioidaceae bacterium]|nr:HAD family hydrolase [Nocardioidaceae bacterium]